MQRVPGTSALPAVPSIVVERRLLRTSVVCGDSNCHKVAIIDYFSIPQLGGLIFNILWRDQRLRDEILELLVLIYRTCGRRDKEHVIAEILENILVVELLIYLNCIYTGGLFASDSLKWDLICVKRYSKKDLSEIEIYFQNS